MPKKLRHLHYRLRVQRRRHVRRLRIASRHPFAVPVAVFGVLFLLAGIGVFILHQTGTSLQTEGNDIVIISHDHQIQIVPSHEATVGALLAKLDIAVNAGDVVEPALSTPIHQDDFRINIYRAAPVKIVDGSSAVYGYSAATTPRSIATQTGLTVYPEDSFTAAPVQNFLTERALGSVVTIDRSIPVTLNVNGFAAATRTRAKTVGDFLKEKKIDLGSTGSVEPAATALLAAGQEVHVVRDGTGVASVTETIDMPVQTIQDDTLAYGTSAVRQQGSAGQRVLTYRTVVQGGKVISQTLLQDVVTVQPVTQIVVVGTSLSGIKGDMALAGIAASDYQYADYIISHESGWCPTKWQGEYGTCPAYHGTPGSASVGYGLCQATPGYKMASAGDDWATNPITQLRWCSGYATSRYGGWYAAYSHWLTYHNW